MRTSRHTHHCERCQASFGCAGTYVPNHDGAGEFDAHCTHYHLEANPLWRLCEDCAMTHWCDHCAEHPSKVEIDGDRLCLGCADALTKERQTA